MLNQTFLFCNTLSNKNNNNYFNGCSIENPIDPPQPEGDPFDVEVLPNLEDCKLVMKHGVVRVQNLDGSSYANFVYPDTKMFIDDYHLLVNFISNGPL